MSDRVDTTEFIKTELKKSEHPVGKLAELESYIKTLPVFIPRVAVEDLTRLGFVYGYVEASKALISVYEEIHTVMNEDMSGMCKEYEDKFLTIIRNEIEKIAQE